MIADGSRWETLGKSSRTDNGGRRLATVSLTFAHLASPVLRLAYMPDPREKASDESEAFINERARAGGYAPVLANLPRSDFLKRDSFPLSRISRAMLE